MTLPVAPNGADSFVDDTSSNLSRTSGYRVSIHAQVLGECGLDWFYRLLKKIPHDGGRELKSEVLARAYFELSSAEQDVVLSSLRQVRVHITDPGPYMQSLEGTIQRISPGQTLRTILAHLGQAKESGGLQVRRALMEIVASNMLWNSPHEELKRRFRIMNVSSRVSVDLNDFDETYADRGAAIDFSPFLNKSGDLVVERVALFSSKAGPVFGAALEFMDKIMSASPGEAPSVWMASLGIRQRMSANYRFDEGNAQALKWVEERRSETLSYVDPFGLADMVSPPPALVAIDSRTSPYVQAADVAAGIARMLFEKDEVRLRATFDYLVLNGQQIGASAR